MSGAPRVDVAPGPREVMTARHSSGRRLTIPVGLLASMVVTAAVVFVYRSDATSDVALWGDVSRAANYALVFVAPLAAGLGAWQGTGERRCGVVELFDAAPRSRLARYLRRVGRDWAWLGLGLLVGVVLCAPGPLRSATWGRLDALLVADSLAGLWLCLAVGFVVGRWLPHRLTVVGVAVVVYVAQGLTAGPTAFGPYVPLLDITLSMSYHPMGLAVPRIALFLALGGLALTAAAAPRVTRRQAVGAVVAALVAALGAGSMPQTVFQPVTIEATSCFGSAPQVCLHPAYAAGGAALAAAAPRVLAPLTDAGIRIDRVVQTTSRPHYDPATQQLTFPLAIVNGKAATQGAATSMLAGIFTSSEGSACDRLPAGKAARGGQAQGIVLAALVENATAPQPGRTDQLSRFLATHWQDLRACTLAPKAARQLQE